MIRGKMVLGIKGVEMASIRNCKPCILGKIAQHPHRQVPPANHDLVVMDLARPNHLQTLCGKLYDMIPIDTFSNRRWIEPLRSKSDAARFLERWIPLVENQCDVKLKRMRSDNGGEFIQTGFGTRWSCEAPLNS